MIDDAPRLRPARRRRSELAEVDLDRARGTTCSRTSPPSSLRRRRSRVGDLPTVLGRPRPSCARCCRTCSANAAEVHRSGERPRRGRTARRLVQRAWRIEVADNGRACPEAHARAGLRAAGAASTSPIDGHGHRAGHLPADRRRPRRHGSGSTDAPAEAARSCWFELPGREPARDGDARQSRCDLPGRSSIRCSATLAQLLGVGVDLDLVDHRAGDQRLQRPHEVRQVDPVHRRAVADGLVEEDDLLVRVGGRRAA